MLWNKRNEISSEITSSWIDQFGLWSSNWYQLTAKEKGDIGKVLELGDRIAILEELDPNVSTWRWKQAKDWALSQIESLFPWIWIKWDKDFGRLKTVSWKTLTDFIKSISGTAVSAQERDALIELMPDPSNTNTKFATNLKELKREYENTLNTKLSTYWFADRAALAEAIRYSQYKTQGGTWTDDFYEFSSGINNNAWIDAMIDAN